MVGLGFVLGPIGVLIMAVLQPRSEATVCRFCRLDATPVAAEVDEDALDRAWETLTSPEG